MSCKLFQEILMLAVSMLQPKYLDAYVGFFIPKRLCYLTGSV